MEWVRIGSYGNRIEAEIAKSLLQSNGFNVRIEADDAGGFRPHLGFVLGVWLLAQKDQAAEAKALLAAPAE